MEKMKTERRTTMRKILLTKFVISILLSVFSLAYAAEYKNPELLVDVETLKKIKDRPDVVILDTRDKALYDKGHIPRAINLGAPASKVLRDQAFRVKKVAALEKILGNAGIDNNKHMVIYGSSTIKEFPPQPAEYGTAVPFFILEYLGHKKVSVLNGGIEAWTKAGNPIETNENKLPQTTYKADVQKQTLVTTTEMIELVKKKYPKTVHIDVRIPEIYHGEIINGFRGGHIPGAINIERTQNYDRDTGGFLRADQLAELYKGIPKNKRIVVSCYSGTGAAHSYIALRLLGYDVAVYDDSWLVWGNNANLPAEEEVPLDFFALIQRVQGLEKQVKELREQMKK
jgi:thiosulfate/3-mercaptopyruvate sulfurtransferase